MQRDSAKSARVYFVIPFISKSPLEVLNYPSKREKKCCRTYDFLIINATAPCDNKNFFTFNSSNIYLFYPYLQ